MTICSLYNNQYNVMPTVNSSEHFHDVNADHVAEAITAMLSVFYINSGRYVDARCDDLKGKYYPTMQFPQKEL